MRYLLLSLFWCATLAAQPFTFNDQAFLGLVQRRPYPQWNSYALVTGSPASEWMSAYGSISLTQGTAGSRPSVTAAAFGSSQGLTFDGTDDYLSVTNQVITATTAGSLSVVFKTGSSVTGPKAIVAQSDSSVADNYWEFGIAANGKLYVSSNASGTVLTVEGSTVLNPSTSYNAILTYDGTDFYMSLNGTEENPLVIASIGAFAWAGRVTGTTVLSVGCTALSTGAARFFNGVVGQVAWWPRDITAQ